MFSNATSVGLERRHVIADDEDGGACLHRRAVSRRDPASSRRTTAAYCVHTNHFVAEPGRLADTMVRRGAGLGAAARPRPPGDVTAWPTVRSTRARSWACFAATAAAGARSAATPTPQPTFGDRWRTLATVIVDPAARRMSCTATGPAAACMPCRCTPRRQSRPARARPRPPRPGSRLSRQGRAASCSPDRHPQRVRPAGHGDGRPAEHVEHAGQPAHDAGHVHVRLAGEGHPHRCRSWAAVIGLGRRDDQVDALPRSRSQRRAPGRSSRTRTRCGRPHRPSSRVGRLQVARRRPGPDRRAAAASARRAAAALLGQVEAGSRPAPRPATPCRPRPAVAPASRQRAHGRPHGRSEVRRRCARRRSARRRRSCAPSTPSPSASR